jgi:alpha 1,3-glucosidase
MFESGALALLWALSLQALFPHCVAVDRSKFRTCDQGSFCRRFNSWTTRPNLDEALWVVLPETRKDLSEGGYSFSVKHKYEADPHLELKLTPYDSGVLRMRLGEIDPVARRHEIPAGDVIDEPPPPVAKAASVSPASAGTLLSFTTTAGIKVEALIRHAPLAVEVRANGVHVQTLNARNFLNFERYRKPQEYRPPDAMNSAPDADKACIDAAAHPFELDKKGLWEEDFGGHTDKKPRGPASYGMDVTFEGDVPAVYGLPEHATKASLPFYSEPYRFFNLDVFEYEVDNEMALYGTVPFLWAVHRGAETSVASGFLWIAPSETFIKLDRADKSVQSWWVSESGLMDVSVFVGPTPAQVSGQFHALTGHAPLPPLWALGKHQCRWNYMNEKDVAGVDNSYDKHDIPYDVVWLDIEHTDGKAYFTWNNANFPTPDKMVESISAKRRKLVNVVDPHIKKDDKFHVYTEVRDKGLFVKKVDWKMINDTTDVKPEDWIDAEKIPDPESSAEAPEGWNTEEDGDWIQPQIDNPAYKGAWTPRKVTDPNSPMSDFEGWCWPGTSLYPDFMDPKMREYWGSQFALDKYKGTNADTYIWNDMNEPSVFNGPEVTMPRDAIHPSYNVEHRDVHNMYGYYVHRATFEGLQKRSPGDRPFVLTRSFFIGSHKYCAIWTGDNTAEWKHLQISIAMVGALAIGGQSLVGADIGGFFKHPDAEMVVRWYQLAVLAYPFLRNHAHLETPRREPYTYDENTMNLVKASIQLRYKMLPLWYTVFEAYHSQGHPVVRPLFWDFVDDAATSTDHDAVENQIMLGDAVLVHGVGKPLSEQTEANVYLPSGKLGMGGWYDLHTGKYFAPGKHTVPLTLQTIPAYCRAGTIVPLKSRIRRSSACMAQDPLSLSVYLTPAGTAEGKVYLDDYRTQAYQDGKSFLKVDFEFKAGVLKASSTSGTLPAEVAADVEKVEVYGLSAAPTGVSLSLKGEQHELSFTTRATEDGRVVVTVKVAPWINLRDPSWVLTVK